MGDGLFASKKTTIQRRSKTSGLRSSQSNPSESLPSLKDQTFTHILVLAQAGRSCAGSVGTIQQCPGQVPSCGWPTLKMARLRIRNVSRGRKLHPRSHSQYGETMDLCSSWTMLQDTGSCIDGMAPKPNIYCLKVSKTQISPAQTGGLVANGIRL